MKLGVPACQPPGTVDIQGVAYQLSSDNEDLVCSTVARPVSVRVVPPLPFKLLPLPKYRFVGGNCSTAPTPAPSSGFALVSDNQRCLEAAPLPSGRRARRRDLVVLTPDACYQACGAFLNPTLLPYYFNLAPAGDCYCCAT